MLGDNAVAITLKRQGHQCGDGRWLVERWTTEATWHSPTYHKLHLSPSGRRFRFTSQNFSSDYYVYWSRHRLPAMHNPQSPRAISQVREKRYDRMGFGFMHTVLKYQNEAVISCLTASGEIRDDCHSNRAKQGSYICVSKSLWSLGETGASWDTFIFYRPEADDNGVRDSKQWFNLGLIFVIITRAFNKWQLKTIEIWRIFKKKKCPSLPRIRG